MPLAWIRPCALSRSNVSAMPPRPSTWSTVTRLPAAYSLADMIVQLEQLELQQTAGA